MLKHLFTVVQQLPLICLIMRRIAHAIAGARQRFSDHFLSRHRHHQFRTKTQRLASLLAKHKRTGGRVGLSSI
ncbi:Uncharacterised protein [Klebsiella michiganensis]|nr:Uncharacterised protein [Klebsiella michiganensis]